MSTRHVVHHKGSPRYDSDITIWVYVFGFIAGYALLAALLPVILAVGTIGGLGYLVVTLNKDFIQVKKHLLVYNIALKRLNKERDALALLQGQRNNLSESDFIRATEIATKRFEEKLKEERTQSEALCATIDIQINSLIKAKDAVLAKSHKLSPEKLKRAIEKLDQALSKYEEVKSEVKKEKC